MKKSIGVVFGIVILSVIALVACTPSIPSLPTPSQPTTSPPTESTIPETPTTTPASFVTDLSGYHADYTDVNFQLLKENSIWSSAYRVPGEANLITEGGFSGIIWGAEIGYPGDRTYISGRTQTFQAIDGLYIPSAPLWGPATENGVKYITSEYVDDGDILIDLDGNKIKRSHFWELQQLYPYMYSVLSDNYRQYLFDSVNYLVDWGVYGVVFDDPMYLAGINDSFAGNPEIIQAFKLYLGDNYDASYLRSEFGIEDLDSFNPVSRLERDAQNLSNPTPLASEYIFFLHEITKQLLTDVKDHGDESATADGKQFVISANTPVLHPYFFRFFDVFDFYVGEFFLYSHDPSRALMVSKVIESLGDKKFYYYAQIDSSDVDVAPTINAGARELLADIYSHPNGAFVPYGNGIKQIEIRDGVYYFLADYPKFDWAVTGNFNTFMQDNAYLFDGRDTAADVGLVYSLSSELNSHGYAGRLEGKTNQSDKSYWGTAALLLDMGVQYDVVFIGDDRVYPEQTRLELSDLQKYSTLILPEVCSITDANVATLLEYVQQGGTIISLATFATHDDRGDKITRNNLQTLRNAGAHPLGKGNFVSISRNIGLEYHNSITSNHSLIGSKSLLDGFKSMLTQYLPEPQFSYTAPHGVVPIMYETPAGIAIFLVNYNLETAQDTMIKAQGVSVSLEGRSGAVYLYDPDQAYPRLIADGASFDFNNLAVVFYPNDGWDKMQFDSIAPQIESLADTARSDIEQLAATGNYLGARCLTLNALAEIKPTMLYDEAHGSAYSLTWEGAAKRNPDDPFARSMRAYREFLGDKFELTIRTEGELTGNLLNQFDYVILDTPQDFSAAEITALQAYIDGGGRVLFYGGMIEQSESVDSFLAEYGIEIDYRSTIFSNNYINWPNNYLTDDFRVFDTYPTFISSSLALDVRAPAIPIGFTGENEYLDLNYNNKFDNGDLRGPLPILAAYKKEGTLLVYSDHSQQDSLLQGEGTLLIHKALLDLLASDN